MSPHYANEPATSHPKFGMAEFSFAAFCNYCKLGPETSSHKKAAMPVSETLLVCLLFAYLPLFLALLSVFHMCTDTLYLLFRLPSCCHQARCSYFQSTQRPQDHQTQSTCDLLSLTRPAHGKRSPEHLSTGVTTRSIIVHSGQICNEWC